MIITIVAELQNDPMFVEIVASELRDRMSTATTPAIIVQHVNGQVVRF